MELLLKETYTDTKVLTSGHSSIGLGKNPTDIRRFFFFGATKNRNLTNHWYQYSNTKAVQQETMDEFHHDSNI